MIILDSYTDWSISFDESLIPKDAYFTVFSNEKIKQFQESRSKCVSFSVFLCFVYWSYVWAGYSLPYYTHPSFSQGRPSPWHKIWYITPPKFLLQNIWKSCKSISCWPRIKRSLVQHSNSWFHLRKCFANAEEFTTSFLKRIFGQTYSFHQTVERTPLHKFSSLKVWDLFLFKIKKAANDVSKAYKETEAIKWYSLICQNTIPSTITESFTQNLIPQEQRIKLFDEKIAFYMLLQFWAAIKNSKPGRIVLSA